MSKIDKNLCLKVTVKELEERGIDYEVVHDSKHVHVYYGPKLKYKAVIGSSVSDRRAWLNARSHIRRAIRQHGLEGGQSS